MSRTTCKQCYRPEGLCYCSVIVPINNQIKVIIIQHPNEYKHPFNTGRIVKLCLKNSELTSRKSLSDPEIDKLLSTPSAILYPNMDWLPVVNTISIEQNSVSSDLTLLGDDELQTSIRQIILIDSTWRKSKRLMFQHKRLQQVPRINLTGDLKSNYRIRKGTEANGLNSLESIYLCLGQLEPNIDFTNLILTFEKMVSLQLSHSRHPS